jgi:alpha,alpha-trehalase
MKNCYLILKHAEKWTEKAKKRKDLLNKYCWNEERGAFMDYDFVDKKQSEILSAASLHPLYVQLANKEQADSTVKAMEKYLETDYGILTCENSKHIHSSVYQWDYPLGWPPLQIIVFQALENYSYINEVCRIAEKYISLTTKCFEETGDLWEKYNLVEGSCDVSAEYEMPAMMGWTAGTFIEAYYLLKKYR